MEKDILIVFTVFAFTVIFIFYFPIVKNIVNTIRLSGISVNDLLNQLPDNPLETNDSIIEDLLNKGYFQVHTLHYGNPNYSDKKQSHYFCSSMNNKDIVKALNELG